MTKFEIQQILIFSAQFDAENYGARVSGHFDSDAEYQRMKLNYIHEKMKDI